MQEQAVPYRASLAFAKPLRFEGGQSVEVLMQDRVKNFAGVHNFRDFGGYPTKCGGKVRSGYLYRSAHYGAVTDEDVPGLDALGVSAIVDLRVPEERRRFPSQWPKDPSRLVQHDVERPDSFLGFVKGSAVTPATARDYMLRAYETIPFDPGYQRLFALAFEKMLREDGGIIVHCMAGKDRTGILCALIHTALGVEDEHVEADYLLTNAASNLEERIHLFASFMEELHGKPLELDAIRALAGVHRDYLQHAFATIRSTSGSVEGYLSDVLKVGAAERTELRNKLVA